MQRIESRLRLSATPDEIWTVIGEADALDWVPMIASVKLEGDTRRFRLTSGEDGAERITHSDPSTYTYSYEYVEGPMPATRYSATLRVVQAAEGSDVYWAGELAAATPRMEARLVQNILGIYHAGLTELGRRFDAIGAIEEKVQ